MSENYIKVVLPNLKISDSNWINKTYKEKLSVHFPYDKLRPSQREAMVLAYDWLFVKDRNVVILQAPTGFGKSVFAWTLAKARSRTFYYTSPQLNLIEQVSREFGIPMVRGRQNFICPITGDLASEARCTKDTKRSCETYCDYKKQRDAGAMAPATAITPAFLLRTQMGDSSGFMKRESAIVDEAHNLSTYISDVLQETITSREVESFGLDSSEIPDTEDYKDWMYFLHNYHLKLTILSEGIKRNFLEKGLNYDEKYLESLVKAAKKDMFIYRVMLRTDRPNCVIELEERGRGHNKYKVATFKLVKAAPVAKVFLRKMAHKHIFMSATILHGKQFLRELGLDNEDTLFIDIAESPIQNKENGPVVVHNSAWLSKKRYATGIDDAVAEIAALLDIYDKEKVVIIPASHNLRADIVAKLSQRGYQKRLMTHGAENHIISCPGCNRFNPFEGDDFVTCPKCNTSYHLFARDNALASFYSTTKPAIMVSTYLREGADLKDDLCRCLIIPKIPYPNLGDKLVNTRMKYDQEDYTKRSGGRCVEFEGKDGELCTNWPCPKPCQLWYRMETVKTLVQAAGRIIRSGTDWGSIHILDKSWKNFVDKNRTIIPDWFLNCVIDKEEWNGKNK